MSFADSVDVGPFLDRLTEPENLVLCLEALCWVLAYAGGKKVAGWAWLGLTKAVGALSKSRELSALVRSILAELDGAAVLDTAADYPRFMTENLVFNVWASFPVQIRAETEPVKGQPAVTHDLHDELFPHELKLVTRKARAVARRLCAERDAGLLAAKLKRREALAAGLARGV